MTITYRTGDLFDSPEQAIVNTVNCYGVMGKGIALEFKQRYPAMFNDYRGRCQLPSNHPNKVRIGRPYVFEEQNRLIVNFPTKNHWRFPSKIAYIDAGLRHFVECYQHWGITAVAFPRLGCENGGLDWESQVMPVMESYLHDLGIPVVIVTWDSSTSRGEASARESAAVTSAAQLGFGTLMQSDAGQFPASAPLRPRRTTSSRSRSRSRPAVTSKKARLT